MRRTYGLALAAAVVTLAPCVHVVQAQDEQTRAVANGGISVKGWTGQIDPNELKLFRPSYRLLSYVLSQQGYAVDPDLAGEDRPDSIRALMRGIFTWAGLKSD